MVSDVGVPDAVRERIDAIAAKYAADPKAAGLVVGICLRGVTAVLPYGSVRRQTQLPPDGDTLFEIGSITKVFTTLLLADMVCRREVELDEPIRKLLPPEVKLQDCPAPITLRHLATHTSGLPRLPPNLDGPDLKPEDPYAHYGEEALLAFLAGYRARGTPGRAKEYSNLGTGLLGYLLARRAGMGYEQLLRERVLGPLGMSDTRLDLSPEAVDRMALPHADGREVPPWDLAVLAGAGGLRSSANDMLRFLAAQVRPGGSPLEAAIELSHRQQFGHRFALSTPYYLLRLAGEIGLAAGVAFALPPGVHGVVRSLVGAATWWVLESLLAGLHDRRLQPIALGWHMEEVSGAGEPILWHNGGTGGSRSYLGYSREKGVGVVVLANSDRDVDAVGNAVLAALIEG